MNNEAGVKIGIDKSNKNSIILDVFKKVEKGNILVIGSEGKGPRVSVVQSLENIKKLYPSHSRSKEHRYKSNNWLKLHNMIKRRKPFKKEYIILDEF